MSLKYFPEKTIKWAEAMTAALPELERLNEQLKPENIRDLQSSLDSIIDGLIKIILIPEKKEQRKLSYKEKKTRVESIFYAFSFKYGFEEQLGKNNWSPWPEEVVTVDCYSQAVANYALAECSGLNPRLIEFVGLKNRSTGWQGEHSLVVVDVGEEGHPENWVIDQAIGMYGPVLLDEETITIENLAAVQDRTHRKDFRKEEYSFIWSITNYEAQIFQQIENLRRNPEQVLYAGQRIGVPAIDHWQSEEAVKASWYLQFNPDGTRKTKGALVSKIMLERPGIKSRGLEMRTSLDNDGEISDDRVIGHYYNKGQWCEFVDSIQIVDIPTNEVEGLIKGLKDIPIRKRAKFESDLRQEIISNPNSQDKRINAARASFKRVTSSEYGETVYAMMAVEALYQKRKESNGSYLTTRERELAIRRLKGTHTLFKYYADAERFRKRTSKTRDRLRKEEPDIRRRLNLLRPDQLEDPLNQAFTNLRTEQERLQNILDHKPVYLDDAIDKLIFYDREIKGKEDQVLNMAEAEFGSDYEKNIFAGYGKIFGEFLGHMAVTYEQLTLEGYKERVIRKIKSK